MQIANLFSSYSGVAQEGVWVAITPPLLPGYPNWTAQGRVPPHLPGLVRRGGGPSPSARAVWADWLEWMGRKTAQAVRNRISSVLASLGTQAEGEE